MKRTNIQTAHKKNLENLSEDFGFNQNANNIEVENLAITSNDRRIFEAIFDE